MATLKNLLVAFLGTAFIALGKAGAVQAAQINGDPQPLGDGFIRSFVTLDDISGNPTDIGITLTPGALSLPTGDQPDIVTGLSLPPEASTTGFNHLELTYRPGPAPGYPDTFAVPRFRLDFFLISPQERALICPNPDTTGSVPTCVGEELAQVIKTPEPDAIPEGHLPDEVAVPSYGMRFFDPEMAFPIVRGEKPFTSAYDYGFSDGEMTLIAVGATKAFIETQPNLTEAIKVPISYPESGYYPTSYGITYDESSQEYSMSLSGLTYRSSTSTPIPEPSSTLGTFALSLFGAGFLLKRKQKQTAQGRNFN